MNAQDRYNNERYTDMTCFLALRNIERKERRSRMKENWIYRRGDVYLANLDPYIGSSRPTAFTRGMFDAGFSGDQRSA